MDYIQAAMRGDIAAVADLSFDCVACGLCALRCPAEIIQHEVGILSKRLTGRYLRKESKELDDRLGEVRAGKFDAEYAELMVMEKRCLEQALLRPRHGAMSMASVPAHPSGSVRFERLAAIPPAAGRRLRGDDATDNHQRPIISVSRE